MRDFFSLAWALTDRVHPSARVYHAHTTGYASLIASCAAQQNNGAFLLTEHNLYVRDTINTLLERNLSQIVTRDTYKEIDDPVKRMWTIWWTEMGAMFYPSAGAITYLYDRAIVEAQDLGGIPEKSIVLPNGMDWDKFAHTRASREGIIELIDTMANLRGQGYTNVIMEVCGPIEHIPDYYQECLQHTRDLGLEDTVIFRGTVNLVDELERYDGLVLSSFNEGQPIVVLEAMSAGLPVIATNVGGLEYMVTQPVGADGQVGPCGALVPSGDPAALAYEIARLVDNPELYMQWHRNGYERIHSEFLMENIMDRYADLYVELGQALGRFRAVVLQPWECEAASRLKEADPLCTVLAYQCLSSIRDYEPGPIYTSGITPQRARELGTCAAVPEWEGYPGHRQQQVWNPLYQQEWVRNVVGWVARSPFDGVMADNDVFADYYGTGIAPKVPP
ncbi:GT4 family glycosyltransferase PelF [Corynebacterium cystitidis]|uniref:GT4 family glycosyltransferase PelF n=1 Tax=Corynebacterium cystitidis TaxID=35757 RepID=UPI001474BD91|nr:GT4 family glycosyltransferase PelF [Corynebacterium cystitidis]